MTGKILAKKEYSAAHANNLVIAQEFAMNVRVTVAISVAALLSAAAMLFGNIPYGGLGLPKNAYCGRQASAYSAYAAAAAQAAVAAACTAA